LRRGRSTCRFGAGLLAIDLVALFQLDQRRLEQRRVGLERFEAELELGVGIVLDEPDGLEQREAPDERGDLGLEGFALGVDGEELWIFAAFLSLEFVGIQRKTKFDGMPLENEIRRNAF